MIDEPTVNPDDDPVHIGAAYPWTDAFNKFGFADGEYGYLTYEVADQPKPCCVADLVFRYY